MVVLRLVAVHVDELVLARDVVDAVFLLGITELLIDISSRHVRSVVNEHLFAQAVEVDLPVGAKAVRLLPVHAVEVAHVVVWRQRLQLRVAEANILNVLGRQHFFEVFW